MSRVLQPKTGTRWTCFFIFVYPIRKKQLRRMPVFARSTLLMSHVQYYSYYSDHFGAKYLPVGYHCMLLIIKVYILKLLIQIRIVKYLLTGSK